MKIDKIIIHNFYSIRDMEITFDDYSGAILIDGNNLDDGGSVGTGKSAILEAITWGLFGKTIRKSTEDSLVNNIAKKDCYIITQVNGNCFIHRSRRPTKLEFYIDDDNETLDNAIATQKLIEKHLEINYKLFLASTVFGQHNLVEFLGATAEDKRTIIRNFLNLDDVFDKREKIKGIKSTLNGEVKDNNVRIKQGESSVSRLTKKLGEIKIAKAEGLDTLGVTENILKSNNYDDIKTKEDRIALIEQKMDSYSKDINRITDESVVYENLVGEGVYSRETTCDVCNNGTLLEEETEGDITYYKKTLNKLVKDIESIRVLDEGLKDEYNNIKITVSSEVIARANKIYTLISEQQNVEESLKEAQEEVDKLSNVNQAHMKELEVMKFWEVAFSEKGLIRYIIRNILDYFNTSCNYFLNFLSAGKLEVTFDEKLQETIYNSGRKVHFSGLSGGERKKLNLAVALSLQRLLCFSEETQTNLLFLDEIAENLDPESIEGLYILLQDLKKTKTLFIITHNKHLKSLLSGCSKLSILKRDGETKLIK